MQLFGAVRRDQERDFHKEMEKLAGRAARIMLMEADHVRERYASLYLPTPLNVVSSEETAGHPAVCS